MEGIIGIVAVLALVIAITALGIVLRGGPGVGPGSPGTARTIDLERRHAHVAQRLELLERDVDAQRRGGGHDSRPVSNAIRRTGSPLSHLGLVRFDAFDDTGGGQSFALAMVDDDGDGFILTSLHSRQSTRVFIKDIRGGIADAPLSAEEEHALRDAGLVG